MGLGEGGCREGVAAAAEEVVTRRKNFPWEPQHLPGSSVGR